MAPHDKTRRHLSSRWVARAAVLSLVAGLAAACSSGGTSSAPSGGGSASSAANAPVDITIVDGSTAASAILPYYAQTAGIFKKYNINATVKFVGAPLAMPELGSGKAQFGALGAPQPEEVGQSGSGVKWLGVWDQLSNFQLVVGPGIHSVADLKGKAIGISTVGSVTNTFAMWVLQKHNLAPNAARYVPLQSSSGIVSGFVGGQVDALLLSPPNSTKAAKSRKGASVLLSTDSPDYAWPFNGLAGNMSWVESHKDATVRVMEAMTTALKQFRTDQAGAEKAIAAAVPGTPADEVTAAYKSALSVFATGSLAPSPTTEKQVLTLITQFYPGQYPNATSDKFANFIDASYAQQADAALKQG
jgi:NitT/TauT family transport system substrate-binding protein